jgi:hypothetical protein
VSTGAYGLIATGVTPACSVSCTPTANVLCSMVKETNQVLGCYTGESYTIGTSTWTKSICAPVTQGSGQPAISAAYCKVRYLIYISYKSSYLTHLFILNIIYPI